MITLFRPRILSITSLICLILLSGCGRILNRGGEVFVPDMPTAAEQFALAHRKEKDLILAERDSERHQVQLRELTRAYQKVVSRFGEDRKFTPMARIRLSQLYKEAGRERLALKTAEAVMKDYADLPMIDAKGRYMRGRILEGMGKRLEAQMAYRDCMDRYKNSEDEDVKRVAHDCEQLYVRVMTIGGS